MIVTAARFCGESVTDSAPSEQRTTSGRRTRHRGAEEAGQADGGGGDGTGEPATKEVQPVRKAGAARRRHEGDMLAAGAGRIVASSA
jgi:hypothetical protein